MARDACLPWALRMAWGRKKGGARREPQFGLAAALSELRLSPRDRIPKADETPEKPSSRRKAAKHDDDDETPRERKPRAARSGGNRRSGKRARGGLYRLFYWGAVLGL